MSGKIDAPDISTIMVEAADRETKRLATKYLDERFRDPDGCVPYRTADVKRLVVQAQLRALHDAGYGIGQITAHGAGDDWRVEGPDLVTAALNHHAQPDVAHHAWHVGDAGGG